MGNRLLGSLIQRDMQYGGGYQIAGTAQRLGAGAKKLIRLIDRKSGYLIREVWSDSDGAFLFDYIANHPQGYVVMELDDLSNDPWLDPACADRVTPELMP